MDVINGILGEKEFKYFSSDDFGNFVEVMDDTVANMVVSYLENTAANQEVVEYIKKHIGEVLHIRTLHKKLREDGTIQILQTISPETILSAEVDLNDVYTKLKELDSVSNSILSFMPARSKSAFVSFKASVDGVLSRMRADKVTPTYPETLKRLEANSFLFYKPNDRGHSTGIGIINYSEQRWKECLHGIEYNMYCDNNGISPAARRAF